MFSNSKIPMLVISFLLVAFIVAGWYGSTLIKSESMHPLEAFPTNTASVLEISNAFSLTEQLTNENSFWQDLLVNENFASIQVLFQTLFNASKSDEQLKTFLEQSFFIGNIFTSAKKTEVLVVCKSDNKDLKMLENNLKLLFPTILVSEQKELSDIMKVELKSHTFYLYQRNGLLYFASHLEAITASINDPSKAKAFVGSSDFDKLEQTKGKRADAYLYLHYAPLDSLFLGYLKPQNIQKIHPASFANYSVVDLMIKKDEILLNGYTSAYDSLNQFLSVFNGQQAKTSQLASALPYYTKGFISYNLSDYLQFFSKQSKLHESKLIPAKSKIDQLIHSDSHEITQQWWTGEMALVIDDKNREYAVFTANSGSEAFRLLSDIAHQTQPNIITETYREIKIKEINSPDFLVSQFGTLYESFQEVYFCVIDESVIFSKSLSEMKSYIDAIILGNNLSKNEAYLSFSDNLSDQSVISVYSTTLSHGHPIFDLFINNGHDLFSAIKNSTDHIQGIGIQISNKNDLFYTGVFISHGQNQTQKTSAWQAELEAPIVAGPFLVKNHATSGNSILVQDQFNSLYLLNAKGDIIWTQALKEQIISDVFSVDFYKNGKWQYLFNTANYLYLIDITGNSVADYPIQLNAEASNGLQLLDYENNRDYRIILAGKNGELYNYELSGRLLKGWQAENTRKEISKPLTHLIANKKDYLIFEAQNGDIIMTDRRGSVRLEIRQSFTNALGSDLYLNKTNSSKGTFLTTDKDGNLIYIPEKGPVISSSFEKMTDHHYFLYADFDGNSVMDFIYVDDKKLRIFDNFKNILLSFDFENPITIKPQLFQFDHKLILGVVDSTKEQLYLFDKNGKLDEIVRKGNTQFAVGSLNKNINPSILIGNHKSLFSYPLD